MSTPAPLLGTEWWCVHCGTRATDCHCLESDLTACSPSPSNRGAWRTLGLVTAAVALYLTGLFWAAVFAWLCAGACAVLIVVGFFSWIGCFDYRHPQADYWNKRHP